MSNTWSSKLSLAEYYSDKNPVIKNITTRSPQQRRISNSQETPLKSRITNLRSRIEEKLSDIKTYPEIKAKLRENVQKIYLSKKRGKINENKIKLCNGYYDKENEKERIYLCKTN